MTRARSEADETLRYLRFAELAATVFSDALPQTPDERATTHEFFMSHFNESGAQIVRK